MLLENLLENQPGKILVEVDACDVEEMPGNAELSKIAWWIHEWVGPSGHPLIRVVGDAADVEAFLRQYWGDDWISDMSKDAEGLLTIRVDSNSYLDRAKIFSIRPSEPDEIAAQRALQIFLELDKQHDIWALAQRIFGIPQENRVAMQALRELRSENRYLGRECLGKAEREVAKHALQEMGRVEAGIRPVARAFIKDEGLRKKLEELVLLGVQDVGSREFNEWKFALRAFDEVDKLAPFTHDDFPLKYDAVSSLLSHALSQVIQVVQRQVWKSLQG